MMKAREIKKTRDGYETMRITVLAIVGDLQGALDTWKRRGWEHTKTQQAKGVKPDSYYVSFRRKLKV